MTEALILRTLYIISFLCIAHLAIGQVSPIDSLQQLIDHEGDTPKKVELINSLSFFFFGYDIERANASTEEALLLAKKIGDRSGEGWALAYRGLYYFFSGDLSTARSFLNQSLSAGKDISDQNLQTYSLTQIGNVYRDKGDFDSTVLFYRKAQKQNSLKPNVYYESVIMMNMARYYLVVAKPDSALQITKETVKIREQLNEPIRLAGCIDPVGKLLPGERKISMRLPVTTKRH